VGKNKIMSLTEAQLKRQIEDYLTYRQNAGDLMWFPMNSGKAFVKRGGKDYMIQLCDEGTADLLILRKWKGGVFCEVLFFELKSDRGRTSSAQNAFKILVEEQGASYSIVRSLEELEKILGI